MQVVGQDHQLMIVGGVLQEALRWMDLQSASGGEGALVSVIPTFVDTGVGLLTGPLLGHTVTVTVNVTGKHHKPFQFVQQTKVEIFSY